MMDIVESDEKIKNIPPTKDRRELRSVNVVICCITTLLMRAGMRFSVMKF